ncbi:hypothetical protein CGZ98_20835 [Enemella evansiae]|nr:hypothetical protein CGZ98_20835 [Enemella evansiae]
MGRMASGEVRTALRELVQGGDVLSLATARELPIDADALMRAAGVRRISDLRPRHVRDLPELGRLTSAPQDFLAGDAEGRLVGDLLSDSLARGIQLWIFHADTEGLERLQQIFGTDQVHLIGEVHHGQEPLAINPLQLAEAWSADDADPLRRAWLAGSLSGIDTLRTPPRLVRALERLEVPHVRRSAIGRWLRDPAVFFYVVVLIYSALRALPVTFVKEFKGHLGILWAIDMLTAIPYTWGVIAMVTAKRRLVRALGTLVTAVTFVAPYVYFWATGENYPWWVVLVVALLILSGFLIEGWKIWTDRRITAELARTGMAAVQTSTAKENR